MKADEIKESILVILRNVEIAINLKPMFDSIDELERLAEIGSATEKTFEDGSFVLNKYEFGKGTMLENIKRISIEELLVWAKLSDWAKED